MSEEEASKVIDAVLSSVKHMHEHGVVHRDMNPTNVFLSEDGQTVKVLDFNVSKLIQNSETNFFN